MTSLGPEQAVVKINHLKGFITVLQAVKPSNNKQVQMSAFTSHVKLVISKNITDVFLDCQICTVILCSDGLWIKWDDSSKSLQSSLFLGQQVDQLADTTCKLCKTLPAFKLETCSTAHGI